MEQFENLSPPKLLQLALRLLHYLSAGVQSSPAAERNCIHPQWLPRQQLFMLELKQEEQQQ